MSIFKRWKYRVRDCERRMVGYYDTLEEVQTLFQFEPFLFNLLEQGESIQDGARKLKVDIAGTYYDNTWEI
jgi:hypothetical protein